MIPDSPELPEALDLAQHRDEVRKKVMDKAYKVAFMVLDRLEKDARRGRYSPKHPPAVVFGILADKIVALEAASRNVPPLPQGSSINIFAEVGQLATVFEKVANAGNQPRLPASALCEDDPAEPLHTGGPQAAPEAGGVPPGDGPGDGRAV